MTDSTRPDAPRTIILDIPLPDARPRPVVRTAPVASGPVEAASDVRETRPAPAVPSTHPVAPVRPTAPVPDIPAPTSDWTTEPDGDEDAVGEWYVVRPITDVRPRPRARAASPTGRAHLTTVAVAIPAAGATGILVSVVDTLSAALAAVVPIAAILGVAAAWLFLSRLGAWARDRIAAAAAVWRR